MSNVNDFFQNQRNKVSSMYLSNNEILEKSSWVDNYEDKVEKGGPGSGRHKTTSTEEDDKEGSGKTIIEEIGGHNRMSVKEKTLKLAEHLGHIDFIEHLKKRPVGSNFRPYLNALESEYMDKQDNQ